LGCNDTIDDAISPQVAEASQEGIEAMQRAMKRPRHGYRK
jgi:hypothetical protein